MMLVLIEKTHIQRHTYKHIHTYTNSLYEINETAILEY